MSAVQDSYDEVKVEDSISAFEEKPLESFIVNRLRRGRRYVLPDSGIQLPTGDSNYTGPGRNEEDYPNDYAPLYYSTAAHEGGKLPRPYPMIVRYTGSIRFLKARLGLLEEEKYDRFRAWVIYFFFQAKYTCVQQLKQDRDRYL